MPCFVVAFILFELLAPLRAQTSVAGLDQARELLDGERFSEAGEAAARLLEASPKSGAARAFSGEVHFREGEIPAAEDDFRKAIQLEPKTARAWWGMSKVFDCSSLHGVARTYLTRAHRLGPEDPDIYRDYVDNVLQGPELIAVLERSLTAAQGNGADTLRQRIDTEKKLVGKQLRRLVTPYEAQEIPMVQLRNGVRNLRAFGLMVTINGSKPLKLLLDTGAGGITLREKAAGRVNLVRLGDTMIGGIGDQGEVSGYAALAGRVRIGPVEFADLIVKVGDTRVLADEDGLIGADVFAQFLMTLDFTSSTLRLAPLPKHDTGNEGEPSDRYIAAEMRHFTPVYRFGHLLLIPARLGDSSPMLFLIDTGAEISAISQRAVADITSVRRDSRVRVQGLSGKVAQGLTADQLWLQFAGFRQRNLDMITFNLDRISRRTGTEISGILGFSVLVLFDLTIDYRDGLVNFDYRLKFPEKKLHR